jgi:hypothetical protein
MTAEPHQQLDDIKNQLVNARKVLKSIMDINHSEGTFNEHVLHSETVAKNLVIKLEKDIAVLSASPENTRSTLV